MLHKPRTAFDDRAPPRDDSHVPFVPLGVGKEFACLKLIPIQTRISVPTESRSEPQMPGKSASMERLFVSLYYRLFYFIVLDEGRVTFIES